MELEVSYNKNYCPEGRVERRTGSTDSEDGGGEVVGCAKATTSFGWPNNITRLVGGPTRGMRMHGVGW